MANSELKYVSLSGLSAFWTGVKDKLSISKVTYTPNASDVVLKISQGVGDKECTINAATATTAGIMSATDKTKLTNIEAGAQVNIIEKILITADDTVVPVEDREKAAILRITTNLDDVTAESNPLRPASALAVVNYVKSSVSHAQNTINDTIVDISNSVSANTAAIATHAGRLTTLETTSTAHTAAIATHSEAIAAASAAIAANAAAIGVERDARAAAIDALRKEILTDGTADDAINDAYDTLQEVANWISTSGTAAKNATQIITELNAVSATASANAAAIATNAANIATNLASINSINDVISNISASVVTNAATITAHAARLTTLETTSAAHTKAIEDNAESIQTNANAIALNTTNIALNATAIGAERDARTKAIGALTAVVTNVVNAVNFTFTGTNNENLTIDVSYVNGSSTSVGFSAYTESEINSIFEPKA